MKSCSDNTFLVTGASGFVGKSVLDKLKKKNPKKIFTPTSSDFNLTKENETFCIKISNIVSSLRNCHAQHFIQLSKPKNSTNIVLRVFEPEVHNFSPIFSLALNGVIDSHVIF